VHMMPPIRPGVGNHAEHCRSGNSRQRWRRYVVRIQEYPRATPDALCRVRLGAAEDRGGNENGQHGEYLSNKACPRGRIQDDVLGVFCVW
jgi:hypothetical protein